MAVQPVFRRTWRGRIRSTLRTLERHIASMGNYNTTHPVPPFLSADDINKMNQFLGVVETKLEQETQIK